MPTVLALGCVGLGLSIYYDFQVSAAVEGVADVAAGAGGRAVEPLPSVPLFVMRPIQSFGEIVERPIFMPSRRSANDVGPDLAAPAIPLMLELKGVVIGSDTRVALVTTENDPTIHRLRLGESYDGWELISIEHEAVTLRRGGQERRLELAFEMAPPRPRGRRDARRQAADGNEAARP